MTEGTTITLAQIEDVKNKMSGTVISAYEKTMTVEVNELPDWFRQRQQQLGRFLPRKIQWRIPLFQTHTGNWMDSLSMHEYKISE